MCTMQKFPSDVIYYRVTGLKLMHFRPTISYTVNNYRQVTGMVTGENFAFFIYRHFVEIL